MMAIQDLIEKVYEFSAVGGHLHIITDDHNTRDVDLKFCTDLLDRGGYGAEQWDATPEEYASQIAAERACLDALWKLTKKERLAAVIKFWETDGRIG
jgi:hypothetical protein